MKFNFETYLETLKDNEINIQGIVDVKKIFKNMQNIEADLNSLNYLICNSISEFKQRVSFLYEKNPNCFHSIFLLLAIRKKDTKFIIGNQVYNVEEILSDKNKIIALFIESEIIQFILKGKIKSFVDYVFGIEVGMDTNARKNRNGNDIEEQILEKLKVLFKNSKNIEIYKQKQINKEVENFKHKKVDIVICNKLTHKTWLIESSFYNTQGSKINETARSYFEIYNKIKQNLSSNYTFIWLADGQGMKSIRNDLKPLFEKGYIWNHKFFFENIKKLVENN